MTSPKNLATATIVSGKAKITVNLVPDGDNRLKGSGVYASTPDMKAIANSKTRPLNSGGLLP